MARDELREKRYGDMAVYGSPPAPLERALDFLARRLHPSVDESGKYVRGKSKESCVLMALLTRDFLKQVGFADAKAVPVFYVMTLWRGTEIVHRLGMGKPDEADRPGRWSGHMVTLVPSAGYLIDPVLYQAARPHWSDLPGMAAAPLGLHVQPKIMDFTPLTNLFFEETDETTLHMGWLDTPANQRWKEAPDFKRQLARDGLVKTLVREFKTDAAE